MRAFRNPWRTDKHGVDTPDSKIEDLANSDGASRQVQDAMSQLATIPVSRYAQSGLALFKVSEALFFQCEASLTHYYPPAMQPAPSIPRNTASAHHPLPAHTAEHSRSASAELCRFLDSERVPCVGAVVDSKVLMYG